MQNIVTNHRESVWGSNPFFTIAAPLSHYNELIYASKNIMGFEIIGVSQK